MLHNEKKPSESIVDGKREKLEKGRPEDASLDLASGNTPRPDRNKANA
jgi:hypothetical protein